MQIKAADAHDQLALVSPFLLQTLADVAEAKGVSAERLCRGLGFTLDDLQDPTLRISYRQGTFDHRHRLAIGCLLYTSPSPRD